MTLLHQKTCKLQDYVNNVDVAVNKVNTRLAPGVADDVVHTKSYIGGGQTMEYTVLTTC